MNYLSKRQFTTAKSNLTRVVNRYGESDPQKVIDLVDKQYAEWDAGDYAYPDDWHRWERAKNDALYQVQRNRVWS